MSFAHFLLTLLAAVATVLLLWFDIIGLGWALILYLLLVARIVLAKGSRTTLVNFIWAVLVMTLLCTLVSYWWLGSDPVQAVIYSKKLLKLMLTGTTGRAMLSILMGLLGSVLTIILPLHLVLRVSTEWILALSENMGVDRKLAWKLLFSLVLGINKPYTIVQDGEKKISKPAGILDTIGGPGLVVIKPYNAIVCEQSGRVSKIIGPGVTTLDQFEVIKAVITLRGKWESLDLKDVMTKDNVPLLVRGGVGFRIMDARAARERRGRVDHIVRKWNKTVGEPDYAVYQWTLYKAVYGVSEAEDWDWMKQSKGVGGVQVRAAIGQYRLDEIFIVDEEQRVAMHEPIAKAIADKAKEAANNITAGWGVVTTGIAVDYLEMPAKVQEDFLERWRFPWKGWQTILEAEASGTASVLRAGFEENAKLIEAISQARRHWNVVKIGTDERATRMAAARLEAELHKIEQLSQAQSRQDVAEIDSLTSYIAAMIEAISRWEVAEIDAETAETTAIGESRARRITAIGKALRHWEVMKIGMGEEATRIAAAELEAELKKIDQIRQAETRQEVATRDSLAGYITAIIDAVSRWKVSEIDAETAKTAATGESEANLITAIGEALQHWEVIRIGTDARATRKAAARLEAEIRKIDQLGQARTRRQAAKIDAETTITGARAEQDAAKLERQMRIATSRDETENEVHYYVRLFRALREILGGDSAMTIMQMLVERRASTKQLKFISGILDIASRGPRALSGRWRVISRGDALEGEDVNEESGDEETGVST